MKFHPILCNYYITTRCNARCVFCDIHQRDGRNADSEIAKRHMRELAATPVRFVDLTGGEPLLHPDLPLILESAKSAGLLTTVTTNAILYPRRAREIAGRVDFLHFSLDAADPSVHDRLRGVPSFHRVLESLAVARSLGQRPDLLFTLTDSNADQLPVLAARAARMRVMLIVNPVFSYFGNPEPGTSILRKALEFASHPWVYVNRAQIRLMASGGNRTEHPRCRAVDATMVIDPLNRLVLPCFHRVREFLPIDRPLKEMLTTPRVQAWRKAQGRLDFCRGCAIACYFDASFTLTTDRYFRESSASKIRYFFRKTLRRNYLTGPIQLEQKKGDAQTPP